MRALYEINADLEALLGQVDEETGEIMFDPEALDALLMEREQKLEGVALAIKNITAEAVAIKTEEDALKERRQRLEKKKDGLLKYLQTALEGEKFETARVAVSYRKSQKTEITDADTFMEWASQHDEYLTFKAPEPNKTAIKAAIKDGAEIPGAALVDSVSMTIK
jgi:DNA repair exonuclease SbcCD ATPase subunit